MNTWSFGLRNPRLRINGISLPHVLVAEFVLAHVTSSQVGSEEACVCVSFVLSLQDLQLLSFSESIERDFSTYTLISWNHKHCSQIQKPAGPLICLLWRSQLRQVISTAFSHIAEEGAFPTCSFSLFWYVHSPTHKSTPHKYPNLHFFLENIVWVS